MRASNLLHNLYESLQSRITGTIKLNEDKAGGWVKKCAWGEVRNGNEIV